ncbi:MAG: Na+/H+ antiporter subunit E [Paracoccaceae bacterium]
MFALWLLLSGIYKPLVVGFGLVSVLVVLFVVARMDDADDDRVQLRLKPVEAAKYFVWLMVEIAKANWAVTKIILSPSMPIRQHFFAIPYTQMTDLGQVIYANSITLTPGTITIETEPDTFLVHAVAYTDDDIAALADMDGRVSKTEKLVAA